MRQQKTRQSKQGAIDWRALMSRAAELLSQGRGSKAQPIRSGSNVSSAGIANYGTKNQPIQMRVRTGGPPNSSSHRDSTANSLTWEEYERQQERKQKPAGVRGAGAGGPIAYRAVADVVAGAGRLDDG
jgi:hypothetical protein